MINVFAIDPGGTTGWCFVENADLRRIPEDEAGLDIIASEIGGDENQQATDLMRMINKVWPCAVIIEDFIPQVLNKERHFLSPVRITAKLELLLWQSEHRWWRQMPALAKNTIPDARLKTIDLWLPGQPHANDAQRHALTYLRSLTRYPERHGDLTTPRLLETNGGIG